MVSDYFDLKPFFHLYTICIQLAGFSANKVLLVLFLLKEIKYISFIHELGVIGVVEIHKTRSILIQEKFNIAI